MLKNFLNLNGNYCFEIGDWYALTMVVNVLLVVLLGLSASWFGLAIAIVNIGYDLRNKHRHINDFILHLSSDHPLALKPHPSASSDAATFPRGEGFGAARLPSPMGNVAARLRADG